MAQALNDLLQRLEGMPQAKRQEVERLALEATSDRCWLPNIGPQAEAYYSPADELLYGGEAGGGKALALDTPLPTPDGWTTMGEVRAGDAVFDDQGQPCRVVAVSPVMVERPCYEVTFSDGSRIVADAGHQWATWSLTERGRHHRQSEAARKRRCAKRSLRGHGKRPDLARRNAETATLKAPSGPSVRTTEEIAATLKVRGRINHSVAVAEALACPEALLPIDPYLFGIWLGDGTTRAASVTTADDEVLESFRVAGYGVSERRAYSPLNYGITGGLKVQLRQLGVLGNKHVPSAYLRGSLDQRLALLQGLMDSDGYCDQRGQCEFTTTRPVLADGLLELLASLGIKASVRQGWATLNGRRIGRKYRLKFLTDKPAFRLPRKLIRQKRGGFRGTHERRYIVAVDRCSSVPVRCIQVDSPSRLYLAGAAMVPTHNSDLLIGLAIEEHARSLILRRFNDDARALSDRAAEVVGHRNGLNGQTLEWRFPGGKQLIEFGGCQHEDDKQRYKGRPHDFIGFDELADFTKSQYDFITTWNRSADPNQRCRVIGATNPPTTAEGMWIVEHWAPWLDPNHPNPAKPGEIRWFFRGEDGVEREVDGPGPYPFGDQMIRARSRSFIRSRLSDNPDLSQTNYAATLASLPEHLRAAYRDGRFDLGLRDAENQVIPTAWIREAQKRWTSYPPPGVPMCAIGVDCTGGGDDPLVLAPRYDGWFAPMVKVEGKDVPIESVGKFSAGIVIANRRDNAEIVVDMGGGYGGPLYEVLSENDLPVRAHKGAEKSTARTADRQLGFYNKRAEIFWRFREALDPDQPGGSPIMLPDNPRMVADLTAITFETGRNGIQVTPKKKVMEALGRSTDDGDAVVMSWSAGGRMATHREQWSAGKRRPQVVHGHESKRRRRR